MRQSSILLAFLVLPVLPAAGPVGAQCSDDVIVELLDAAPVLESALGGPISPGVPANARFVVRMLPGAGAGDTPLCSQSLTFSTLPADGSATAGEDFITVSVNVTLSDTDRRAEVMVPIIDDALMEPDEDFFAVISEPPPLFSRTPTAAPAISRSRARAVILDDDRDEVRLDAVAPVAENAGAVVITVRRDSRTGTPASVRVSTSPATAQPGEDYQTVSRVFTWAAGESGGRILTVPLVDDNVEEAEETFTVSLSGATGTTLGAPSRLPVTVLDDDTPGEVVVVGDGERLRRVGDRDELAVRVTRADGVPVAGARVVWRITEGAGELVAADGAAGDAPATLTDGDGVARVDFVADDVPGVVRVTATLASSGDATDFEITVEGDLRQLGGSPGEQSVAGVLDEACVGAEGELGALCEYVFRLPDDDQRTVVREATPREAAAVGNLLVHAAHNQFDALDERLRALRRGDASQTSGRQPGDDIAVLLGGRELRLGQLRFALAHYRDEEAWLDDRVREAVARAQEPEEPQEPAQAEAATSAWAGEVEAPSRLGVFVSGRVATGERDGTAREAGFDLDLLGLVGGVDYRLSPGAVVGGAFSYQDSEGEVAADGGDLEGEGWSLAAYGTWFGEVWWAEGNLSWGRTSLTQRRNVDLPVPFQGLRRFTPRADVDADQLTAAVTAGWDRAFGALTVGGSAGLSWVDAGVDGYRETGGGPFDLVIREQDVESLQTELAAEVSWAASTSWGVLQPLLRAAWLHELEDDPRLIRGHFAGDLRELEFVVPTEAPDRDFLNLALGVTATLPRGRSLYLLYDRDLERAGLEMETVTFGLRLEL